MLQGSAKVFIRNLNSQSTAAVIVTMIEEAGVNTINMYRIKNKTTGNFTGLVEVVPIGNNEVNK